MIELFTFDDIRNAYHADTVAPTSEVTKVVNARLAPLVASLEKLRAISRAGLGCTSRDVVDAYNSIRPAGEP